MQAELQAHLKNHGLNLALRPLLSVGVDAPQALRYIDDEVIECMQRKHGLALATPKFSRQPLMPCSGRRAARHTQAIFWPDRLCACRTRINPVPPLHRCIRRFARVRRGFKRERA